VIHVDGGKGQIVASDRCRELEEQIQGLTTLISVAKTVVSTLELDQVLTSVLESSCSLMSMPAGVVGVYSDRTHEMVLHVHSGLTDSFVRHDRWAIDGRGDTITGKAMASGVVRYVPDLTRDIDNRDTLLINEGIRSVVCVPLELQGEPVGVIYLYDFSPRHLYQRQLDQLAVLASFAVMAINNASLHARTKQLAITDALTGLHNSRYFKQLFPQEMARSRRFGKHLSLLMLDIDHFKKINDTFGHPRGDQVLAGVGKVLTSALRAADFSFRYGGEEFAVMLPETPLDGAFQVAEMLRDKIRSMPSPLAVAESGKPVTVSIGVACFPNDTHLTDQLLKHADHCLYRAKEQGRDRVYWETAIRP
jgi:diguanylate cyclase (GGDEF)-like protein